MAMKHISVQGRIASAAAVAAVVGGLVLLAAGPASAHVTVNPSQATQGSQARLSIRVPTESDNASTVKVELFLATTAPVATVLIMPVPGWTATVTTRSLATPITNDDGDQVSQVVSSITWVAGSAATAIKPGQFQEFPIELGPLPRTPSMTLKVVQTYSDGSVVRWIDESVSGQPEPEHPAAVLTLVPATAASPPSSTSGGTAAAVVLALLALLAGAAGAVMGGVALARSGKSSRG